MSFIILMACLYYASTMPTKKQTAEAKATGVPIVKKPVSPWLIFLFGLILGGSIDKKGPP